MTSSRQPFNVLERTYPKEWELIDYGNYRLVQTYILHKGRTTREVAITMTADLIRRGWNRGNWHWTVSYRKFGVSGFYEGREHTLQTAMDKADEIAWNSVQEIQRMIDEGNY